MDSRATVSNRDAAGLPRVPDEPTQDADRDRAEARHDAYLAAIFEAEAKFTPHSVAWGAAVEEMLDGMTEKGLRAMLMTVMIMQDADWLVLSKAAEFAENEIGPESEWKGGPP